MKEKYSIGELSKLAGLSVHTLRYYDKLGLLTPAVRNEKNGYRYYSHDQIEKLQVIRDLQSFGLSLEEIKEYMVMKSNSWLNDVLKEKMIAMRNEIVRLTNHCKSLESVYGRFNKYGNFAWNDFARSESDPFTIEMIELKKLWVLSTRYESEANTEQAFSERCLELQQLKNKYNLFSNGPYIAVFHGGYEKQFTRGKVDLEVCMPVIKPENFTCPELTTIGGDFAVGATYKGPYRGIKRAYDFLIDWCERNDYEISGPSHEYYYNDMTTTQNEEEYITKIYFYRRKKKR